MARRPAKKPAATKAGKAAAGSTGKARRSTGQARSTDRATGAAHGGAAHGDAASALRAAFLRELAAIGWRDLSYVDVVTASGLPMAEAYRIYQSKMGVLIGVVRATDRALLESIGEEPLDGSPRDRLFDLIMRRFDQHAAHKAAFSALLNDLRHHPLEALCLSTRVERSMALLLDLAGVPSSGLRGALRAKALAGLYLHVLRHWLKDESADSASTMALLDKRLEQVERLLGFIRRARPHHHRASEAGESSVTA
ncbi:MAG TPA: hypothetical protein VND94_03945 [Terriglobia bacterium]|nr:hypothetical protein [Terriglobia bacterium]